MNTLSNFLALNTMADIKSKKGLPSREYDELLSTLRSRFEENMDRHKGIEWEDVQERLLSNNEKLWSLSEMERTGGEPDVVGYDENTKEYIFFDCSEESPKERRNTCYDKEGQNEREKKGIHPEGNAVDMAMDMGIELLTENEYRELQKLGEFDLRSSSWIYTPKEIRELGGALYMDRRYDHVFVYHNSVGTFYSVRGFRGKLRV